jgi:hypothetical protein
MQGLHLLFDQYPAYVQQETDTATPRTPIPIYYIHNGSTPFCKNPCCFCQRGKRAGGMLYKDIAEGKLLLAQLAAVPQSGEDAMSYATGTQKSSRIVIHVDLIPGVPEACQLYGHDWELTEHPDIKECKLCHMRGYCPGCTPVAPAGAQPFTCTHHARQRQVLQ